MKCEILHLDTCLSDYFQGFDGTVLAVPVDSDSTNLSVIEGIGHDAANSYYFNENWEWKAFEKALADLKKDLIDKKEIDKTFDPSLEPYDDQNDCESVYAYFGVKFDSDD